MEGGWKERVASDAANGCERGKHYIQAEPFWMKAEQGPRSAWQLAEVSAEKPVEGVVLQLEAKDGRTNPLNDALLELREKATEDQSEGGGESAGK